MKLERMTFKLHDVKIEPKEVKVRSLATISIKFSLNQILPKGSEVIFRIRGGRNNKNDWYYLQPYDPKVLGYCRLETAPNSDFMPILSTGKELYISFLFHKKSLELDTRLKFSLYNTLVQSLVEEKKKIEVLIKKPNEGAKICKNIPLIDVKNEEFDHLKIIIPSVVAPTEYFDILIRAEDKFKNIVEEFSSELEIFLIFENGNNILLKKIEIPNFNNGILKLEGLKNEKSGLFKIQIITKNKMYLSNPCMCKVDPSKKLYWGFIHGHTTLSDGMRSIDEYFNNLIKAGLDFGTSTEHDHIWETSDEDFKTVKQIIKKYHKNHEFISFFGYEWGYWYTGYGDICIYFYDDSLPLLRSDTNKYNSTEKLIKNLKPHEGKVLMVGHHSALRPGYRDWNHLDDSIERLVEIYSTWGCQENSHKNGNPLPPRYKFFGYGPQAIKKGPLLEREGSFVQDALLKGYKIGFTAGGDDHFGLYPSGSIDPDNGIYPPGIMAVWAEDLTKENIWNALYNRKCYGTTGPRIIIEFYVDKYFIGDCVDIDLNLNLNDSRELRMNLISPIEIKKIEIIRNNQVVNSILVNHENHKGIWVDNTPFDFVSIPNSKTQEKLIFYYLRVTMDGNEMAWSSPIWITKNQDEKSDSF